MTPTTTEDPREALQHGWPVGDGVSVVGSLPGDIDTNFRVTAPDGTDSVLKFVHPSTPDEVLEMEDAALRHLVRRLGEGTVPRPIPTRGGRTLHVEGACRVRRLTWLGGPTLAAVLPARIEPSASAERFFRSIGRFMGRVDLALADFTHPAAARPHRWDPLQGAWVQEGLRVIPRPASRALLERVLRRFGARVEPVACELPRSVIQGDGNDHNLIVDADDPWAGPVGVIDFGDLLETARICEPAVAAAYAAMRSGDPVGTIAEVVAGWSEELARAGVTVTDLELDVVAPLVRMRLAISVTMSAGRARECPGDTYLTVSEAPAWALIEALDGVDDAYLTARVRRACGRNPAPGSCRASGSSTRAGTSAPTDVPAASVPAEGLLARRRARTGPSLALSYAEPVHMVRGWRQYLYDAQGRTWLDLYNNVAHVGHSHPHVTEAIARQTGLLATNTRYLSQLRLDYIDRLAALFPDPLDTVWLLNSASEANELALRIARTATGRRDLIVQDAAYHGHTSTLIDASPYKAHGPGGGGTPAWVHPVALPDPYRGRWRAGRDADPGVRYANDLAERVDQLCAEGCAPAALLLETFPGVGGQIVPPKGYLPGAYAAVRDAGGVVIADEVQTGLGRLGRVMWGFETESVVPDLVVLGKPLGNGFPLAAVITTRALSEAFDTGMEFFSTFGGNPVACAAGTAVLDVLDDERLPANAECVGAHLRNGLADLVERHESIGDVRGMGLFLGVEIVTDRDARTPDPDTADRVVEGLKARGILTGVDGPDHNVIKLRGPLVLTDSDAERVVEAIDTVLSSRPT
ncbi:MAG: aminotransferase class III-fold pyridoxal phosphate-dependent enzyme [Longimicrobiales bacterium]|nr:aminotransferase class III-fold pyridoxal phosphate-dependent enzyme [Longimicrobiales bacterium]